MIYAFSGPSCSGKTTLVNSVAKRLKENLNVSLVEEVARKVFREKFFLFDSLDALRRDKQALLEYEIAILENQIEAEEKALAKSDIVLSDRSIYDAYVYSKLHLPETYFEKFKRVFEKYANRRYDIIFLCHPVSPVSDGFRTTSDLDTQLTQLEMIRDVLNTYFSGKVVEIASTDLKLRIKKVMNYLKFAPNSRTR